MGFDIDILTVDDHRMLLSGLRMVLETRPEHRVVAEATNAREALQMTREHQPDVVILDLTMPGGSGLEVISRIAGVSKVLVMSMHHDAFYVRQCLQQGASGYISKEASDSELLRAVETVANGGIYIYPPLASLVLPAAATRGPQRSDEVRLSRREEQVLKLVSLGHTNAEVAAELGVSVRSVETYRARLNAKLGLVTRADLVRYALSRGLI